MHAYIDAYIHTYIHTYMYINRYGGHQLIQVYVTNPGRIDTPFST